MRRVLLVFAMMVELPKYCYFISGYILVSAICFHLLFCFLLCLSY